MTPQEQRDAIRHCLISSDDYEGTYGLLWRAIQGEIPPEKEPAKLTDFQKLCRSKLTRKPKTAGEVAEKIDRKASNVGVALKRISEMGLCKRGTIHNKGEFLWTYWK